MYWHAYHTSHHYHTTKVYQAIYIHRKNITRDLPTIRTNRKRDKSLFRNGYLASLVEPLKSIRSGMHLSGKLKLINGSHGSHIGVTSFIDNKLTYLTSNGTSSVEDLLHLIRFKGNRLGMEGLRITNSSPSFWSDYGVIFFFKPLFTSFFL